jgi:carbonic anhydrase
MGHANCGGIKALWEDDGSEQSQFIHRWVSIAEDAKHWVKTNLAQASDREQLAACEQRSILVSLENLLSFDCIRQRVDSGDLSLHGWYFDLSAGELYSYNPMTESFEKTAA